MKDIYLKKRIGYGAYYYSLSQAGPFPAMDMINCTLSTVLLDQISPFTMHRRHRIRGSTYLICPSCKWSLLTFWQRKWLRSPALSVPSLLMWWCSQVQAVCSVMIMRGVSRRGINTKNKALLKTMQHGTQCKLHLLLNECRAVNDIHVSSTVTCNGMWWGGELSD